MTLALRFVAHSEIGLVRKNNQDSGYASPRLLVVADGMGGAAAGDLASAVAVDTIRRIDVAASDRPLSADTVEEPVGAITGDRMLTVLAEAIQQANDRIADLVEADYALEGMGTTVTGALFDGSDLGLAHIGDSRAYLLRDGRLDRLTHDHSWVQSLVDDGKITDEEAALHPHRSLLLKVLNGQPASEPDLTLVKVQPGDRLLFCSDGLCGLVDEPEIGAAMGLGDLDQAMQRLVDEALAEGGIDNITAILAEVVDDAAVPVGRLEATAAEARSAPDGSARAGAGAGAVILGAAAERDIPVVQPRVRAAGPVDDSEDDEAEDTGTVAHVPSVGLTGAGEPPSDEDDEARYAPQPPKKRHLGRPLIGILVIALILAAGLSAGYAWTRTQYYVGEADQQVAIYKGVSDALPGVALSKVYEIQDLPVDSLPAYYQELVRQTIGVADLEGARQTITELSEAAKRCAKPSAEPSTTPSGQPSGTPSTPAAGQPTAKTPPKPTDSSTAPTSPKPTASSTTDPGHHC